MHVWLDETRQNNAALQVDDACLGAGGSRDGRDAAYEKYPVAANRQGGMFREPRVDRQHDAIPEQDCLRSAVCGIDGGLFTLRLVAARRQSKAREKTRTGVYELSAIN
jgi:hypothetical protein